MTQGNILAGRARDVRISSWVKECELEADELFCFRLAVGKAVYFSRGCELLVSAGSGRMIFSDLYGNTMLRPVAISVVNGPVVFSVPERISVSVQGDLYVFAVAPGEESIGDETQFRLDQQAMPPA